MALHLVTGGGGFVGRVLALDLLRAGHSVRVLDIVDPAISNTSFEFVPVDLSTKIDLAKFVEDVEVVHHLAAAVPLARSQRSFRAMNVEFTKRLFETAGSAGVKHFNFMSSSAVFGIHDPEAFPITVDAERKPFEPYGQSKLEGELYIESRVSNFPTMSVCILRPRTVIGPGRVGIFELLFNWLKYGKTIFLIGSGKNRLQLLHVNDLSRACLLSSEKRARGRFNLGTDRFGTLLELMGDLKTMAGSSSPIFHIHPMIAQSVLWLLDKTRLSPLGPWHYRTSHRDYYFDISRARKELDWHPKYSNTEMMKEAYEWFLANRIYSDHSVSIHHRSLKKGLLAVLTKRHDG